MRSFIATLLLYLIVIPARAEDCIASIYSTNDSSQHGVQTASGIPLDDNALTAAHKSLPFGSSVKVTNKNNGKSAIMAITDRGPYVGGRCIDVTKAGALALGFSSLAPVSVDFAIGSQTSSLSVDSRARGGRHRQSDPHLRRPAASQLSFRMRSGRRWSRSSGRSGRPPLRHDADRRWGGARWQVQRATGSVGRPPRSLMHRPVRLSSASKRR
jgi:rare lipoprotein A